MHGDRGRCPTSPPGRVEQYQLCPLRHVAGLEVRVHRADTCKTLGGSAAIEVNCPAGSKLGAATVMRGARRKETASLRQAEKVLRHLWSTVLRLFNIAFHLDEAVLCY